jgi:hypothetical protein
MRRSRASEHCEAVQPDVVLLLENIQDQNMNLTP